MDNDSRSLVDDLDAGDKVTLRMKDDSFVSGYYRGLRRAGRQWHFALSSGSTGGAICLIPSLEVYRMFVRRVIS